MAGIPAVAVLAAAGAAPNVIATIPAPLDWPTVAAVGGGVIVAPLMVMAVPSRFAVGALSLRTRHSHGFHVPETHCDIALPPIALHVPSSSEQGSSALPATLNAPSLQIPPAAGSSLPTPGNKHAAQQTENRQTSELGFGPKITFA